MPFSSHALLDWANPSALGSLYYVHTETYTLAYYISTFKTITHLVYFAGDFAYILGAEGMSLATSR